MVSWKVRSTPHFDSHKPHCRFLFCLACPHNPFSSSGQRRKWVVHSSWVPPEGTSVDWETWEAEPCQNVLWRQSEESMERICCCHSSIGRHQLQVCSIIHIQPRSVLSDTRIACVDLSPALYFWPIPSNWMQAIMTRTISRRSGLNRMIRTRWKSCSTCSH